MGVIYLGTLATTRYDIPKGSDLLFFSDGSATFFASLTVGIRGSGASATLSNASISFFRLPGRLFSYATSAASSSSVFVFQIAETDPWERPAAETTSAYQSGTWTVEINDASGATIIGALGNGNSAPASGIWHVYVTATASGVVTLSDGTNTFDLYTEGSTATWHDFHIPVVKGTTYTLAGTGLKLLGGNGVITVA